MVIIVRDATINKTMTVMITLLIIIIFFIAFNFMLGIIIAFVPFHPQSAVCGTEKQYNYLLINII